MSEASSGLFARVKAALCLCPEDWPGENEDGHRALRALEEHLESMRRSLVLAETNLGYAEERARERERWLRIALRLGEPQGHRISVDEDGLQHEGDCYWCDIRRLLAASNDGVAA